MTRCWTDRDDDRAWLEVDLAVRSESAAPFHLELIADLGCPVPLIVSPVAFARYVIEPLPARMSNFGLLIGGWSVASIPSLSFERVVPVYASSAVARFVASEGFDGFAGKPFFDLFLWSNGKGGEFCLTYPTVTTKE